MFPQSQILTTHLPSIPPTDCCLPKFSTSLFTFTKKTNFNSSKRCLSRTSAFRLPKCAVSVAADPTHSKLDGSNKPFPAEVSRTIMELSSVGTFSTFGHDGWPLGVGVRFAVDAEGTPVLCLNSSRKLLSADKRSSLHVQLEQSGLRTPQCTIQGSIDRPEDKFLLKLQAAWKKRFGEEVDEDLIHVVSIDRVLQIEDFKEDGIWVSSSEYKAANPDPLREFAEKIVYEINTHNMEDVNRFCNVYIDLNFQVVEAKMVWLDRLGFDVRLMSEESEMFEARIPFPREVTDEKGVKSTFNCMSQLAWEVDKNYQAHDFKKAKQLKKIASSS
ncbi:glutamyl-tRNA reductase-binding protein, chloroplastic isoform X2 [Impatiens glandulifera]|uniref:glutamyl-tRNA reductase-binding protein, chloroplastic isoform X2 n=1 Tax=Impatiens glandulifera TaxID=253017 RepID=UPI001FB04C81|nr:glutamyl-tRNA reductase-binding protein, chloroplastic isoform X2 [Impatiens glandulifera]